MSTQAFKDSVAVVGVGNTNFGAMYRDLDPERSSYIIGAYALKEALEDAGLKKEDVDGLLVMRIPDYGRMAEVVGMRNLSVSNNFGGAGRMAGVTLTYAAMAIHSGLAETVACIYGNDGRSVGARYGGGEGAGSDTAMYEVPYGMTSPGASVGLMFRRHQFLYGTPNEALAHLTINNRNNAALNPSAVMQSPITMEDYDNARFICEPLRLLDYCLINDGAVCLIVTSADRARDLKKPPVYISAAANAGDISDQYAVDDFFYPGLRRMASEVFPAAGIDHKDIDLANLYDNFTPTILFELEGLGFVDQGQAGHWVTPERIARDGELPLNTSGGHTSESYMQGWGHLAECVRQLRHECGPRQVADAQHAIYCCAAPLSNAIIFRR
jgi:acetyl-CoA acetyltransferase